MLMLHPTIFSDDYSFFTAIGWSSSEEESSAGSGFTAIGWFSSEEESSAITSPSFFTFVAGVLLVGFLAGFFADFFSRTSSSEDDSSDEVTGFFFFAGGFFFDVDVFLFLLDVELAALLPLRFFQYPSSS
jgi:hypothetical protein